MSEKKSTETELDQNEERLQTKMVTGEIVRSNLPSPEKPGGTFKPGFDPRRSRSGPVNKAQRAFSNSLKEMLVEEGLRPGNITDKDGNNKMRIQMVVERVYDAAEDGEPWACNLIFDRIEGKAGQQDDTGKGSQVVLVIRGASTDDL